jgi:hypothetical protein
VALAAAMAAAATRLPFAARRLWDHDSVQFALGVERYDLAAHHPHPPGYPLYIAFLKLLSALGVDALHGMVALSILAAALGAALVVPLTARLAVVGVGGGEAARADFLSAAAAGSSRAVEGEAAGLLAAALYVFNPLLWFYGELPLVYAVEGGMTVALAYAALRMADGRAPFVAGCAAFALAGGVRPSTLALLLPLFLLGAWRARRRGATVATLAAGAAAAIALGLAWLLPMLAAAGGYGAYQRIGREHFSALLPYTSILYGAGWRALAHNLTIMTKWCLQGLLPAAVTLAALWLFAARRRDSGRGVIAAGMRLVALNLPFLGAWALPSVLFFALFHVTKAGYTLVYLPALLVAASLLAAPALAALVLPAAPPGSAVGAARGNGIARAAAPFVLLAAAAGAALFLFGADRRPDQPRALAVVRNEFNRRAIAAYERDLDRLLAVLRGFPPATTVLATVELSGTGPAGPEGFLYPWQRHLQWYLPAYEVVHLVPEERLSLVTRGHQPFHREGTALVLPPETRRLAIVLSGPTGTRFPLAAWPEQRIGETFRLVVIPFSGRLDLPPFVFATAAAAGRRAA